MDFFSSRIYHCFYSVGATRCEHYCHKFSTNACGYSHVQKLYLVVSWVSYVGEECQVASAATASQEASSAESILTPDLSLTSLFNTVQKSSLRFVFSAVCTYSHTNQRPKQPYITSNLFHLCPDADDKLTLRTNSIITNNPRSWQAHKKALMNELFTYFGACSAMCRPGPPKCQFIMRLESRVQHSLPLWPASERKLDISSCIPLVVVRQNMSDGQLLSLKCLI